MSEDRWTEYERREAEDARRERKKIRANDFEPREMEPTEEIPSLVETIKLLLSVVMVMTAFAYALYLARGNLT